MKPNRRSMREEMQKRMNTEARHYERRAGLFIPGAEIKRYKIKEGPNLLDIMGYVSGKFDPIEAESFAYVLRIFLHAKVTVTGEDVICIEQTFKDKARRDELFGQGSYCPICKEHRSRSAKGASKEELDPLRYKGWPRTIYNIFDRRDPGAGAQVMETSAWLLQKQLDIICRRAVLPGETEGIENYIPFMDIEEGKSISFDRQGKDENTQFVGVKFEDRRSPIPESVINAIRPLDEIIAWPTVASIHEAFWGVSPEGAPFNVPTGAAETTRASKYTKQESAPEEDVSEPETQEEPPATEEDDEEALLKKKLAELAEKKKAAEKKSTPTKAPATPAKAPPSSAKKGGENPCPSGYTFGKDIDEKAECENCVKWKDCARENDRLEREGK